jgi:hypothetical protein
MIQPNILKGCDEIRYYTTGNIIDDQMMEMIAEVLEKISPVEFMEFLREIKNKTNGNRKNAS